MKRCRVWIASLGCAAVAALLPLVQGDTHAARALPSTPASRPLAARNVVIHLQVTGAVHYTATLSRSPNRTDTGCFLGKSGRSTTYAVGYNAVGHDRGSSSIVFIAGVQPYRRGVSRYSAGDGTAIELIIRGRTYTAGGHPGAPRAGTLQLVLGRGDLSGTMIGTHIPSATHTFVDITAQWSCPGLQSPPSS